MLLVSIGEGSTEEGHENACLKKLYMNAVGWLPRGNVLVIKKPTSLSFQGITFSGLQVQGKQLLWGGGLCWRRGNDWGKGCGAVYLQRACHGAGHEDILGEIFCENENKASRHGENLDFFSQSSEDRRHLWLITKGVQSSNRRRHWQQQRMIFYPYMEAAWRFLEMILLSLQRVNWT